jgi:hypothetical protein
MDFSQARSQLSSESTVACLRQSLKRCSADPAHLNYEVNTDEYDPEVSTIIPRLSSARSAEDVETILKEELLRHFADIGVSTDNLAPLAAEIWMPGMSSVHVDAPLNFARGPAPTPTAAYSRWLPSGRTPN